MVYFIDHGFASVVALGGSRRQQAEIAVMGREVSEARPELDRLHRLMKESAVLLQLSRGSIRESRMMLSLIEPDKRSTDPA
jgi:hypothetical protein